MDVIRCSSGDDIYCLEMSAVAGVKPSRDLVPAPANAPAGSVGSISHRGRNVPVFDLADLLSLPQDSAESRHYTILIDHPQTMYGLLVESVSRVIRISEDNLLPLPKALEHAGGHFRGIVDFTRERKVSKEAFVSRHMPGVSEPAELPQNRRRAAHQMHLLLNPNSLWPEAQQANVPGVPLDRLRRRHALAAPPANQRANQQMVTFPAGVINDWQLLVGLSISQVVEISEPLPLVPVPGTHEAILGFVHWRNCPVPVIDMQASLHFDIPQDAVNHLLIVRDPRHLGLAALPAMGRIQSLRLPAEHRPCPLPRKSWGPYILGCFEVEERLLILPRFDALSGLAGV